MKKTSSQAHSLKKHAVLLGNVIDNAQIFLSALKNDPAGLLEKLTLFIYATLEKYDEQHPAQQSDTVRLCIAELRLKLYYILNPIEDYYRTLTLNELCRIKYHQVCGLLWNTFDRVDDHIENHHFTEAILTCIHKTQIAKDEDLPHEMKLGEGCLSHYKQMYINMTQDEYNKYEDEQYEHEINTLKNKIETAPLYKKKPSQLTHAATALMTTIRTEQKKASFDKKFATIILRETNQLLDRPYDDTLQDRYLRYAKLKDSSSLLKKVGGFMLGVLGAVIIATSVCAAVATFGATFPLSVIGITIGTSVAAQATAVTTCVGGAALLLSGFGLFRNGMHDNVTKKMHGLLAASTTSKIVKACV